MIRNETRRGFLIADFLIADLWYAQEDSNLQPRSGPELTTGISRPLCQLSYGRKHVTPRIFKGASTMVAHAILPARRVLLRVCPKSLAGITKSSEHETN